jgi:putative transposase
MVHQRAAHIPGGIYLVSSVGEYGQAIFVDDSDRIALAELVARVATQCGAKIHAFSWLKIELLMVLRIIDIPLSRVIQRIASLHARRIDQKLGYRGNLFRHSYRAMLLNDPAIVLKAVAAVHFSPVLAQLSANPNAYPWTSLRAYLGLEEIPWLTKDFVLELLAETHHEGSAAHSGLVTHVHVETPSAYSTAARIESPHLSDQRMGEPPKRPRGGAFSLIKAHLNKQGKPASLEELIQAVARCVQVDPAVIESRIRSPALALARALITWLAMQNGIASLSELAQRLNRCRSSLHETRETHRRRWPRVFDIPLAEILEGPRGAARELLASITARKETKRIR